MLRQYNRLSSLRVCVEKSYDSQHMRFLRPLLALVLLAVLAVAAWLWWSLPSAVDVAEYAPADSLVYVEFNDPVRVVQAIQNSDVWQAASPTQSNTTSPNRVMRAAARAGIGPLEGVLFARTQVALVV